MKLTISTPLSILAEVDDIRHLRAEDATGAFGILPGHADFLTTLSTSVVSWQEARGAEHHAAVRGGVLEVHAGRTVSIATREAVLGDDLTRLETDILTRFRSEAEQSKAARADAQRLYLAALRQIIRYLHPGTTPTPLGAPGGRSLS